MADTDVLLTIDAWDETDAPVTLRFSEAGHIDASHNLYLPRIVASPLINVSPNDGGVFSVFAEASTGDVELANRDGGLDYLAGYALDGRAAVLSYCDGAAVIERWSGTVAGCYERDGVWVVNLRARQEALNDNHPANTYAGDNVLPNGLEGGADDIGGRNKPVALGDCRNVPAVLVNESLLIYQASDLANALVTAVYDDGVRLVLWRTDGAHALGATAITLKNGEGGTIRAGARVVFANHDTVYTVQTGLSGAAVVLASGLTRAVGGNVAVEIVNFYADANALQFTDYAVSGDHDAGADTIALVGGSGAINAGDKIQFVGHVRIYTVKTGLAAGNIVLEKPLSFSVDDGEFVQIAGSSVPLLWGGYQGYFRLTGKPAGAVTCDCITVGAGGDVQGAGDVMEKLVTDRGFTLADASIFNACGKLGLYFGDAIATRELLNRIAKAVGGYYWFEGSVCKTALLDGPAAAAAWAIQDYQIVSIERSALGLGANGIPVAALNVSYDKIETVQPAIDGNVSTRWRQRLSSQFRRKHFLSSSVAARHLLSRPLNVESVLRHLTDVNHAFTRVFNWVRVRRDSVKVTVATATAKAALASGIGSTGEVFTPRHGYSAGRKMILVGYEIDDGKRQVTLRLVG